jgi:membrane-associated phospholipid phosphatase
MPKEWIQRISNVWRPTRGFLLSAAALLLLALYIHWDLPRGADLIWFNSWRGSWTDTFFQIATRLGEEHSYILLTMLFFFIKRKDMWWIPLTGLTVMVASFLLKSMFRAPRPGAFADEAWFSDQLILVEGVRPLTGMTSFPSGHTMSAFALALMVTYLLPLRRGWWISALLLAALVGVSRVYLVLHFLEDVLLGAIIGMLLAFLLALIHRRGQSLSGMADSPESPMS